MTGARLDFDTVGPYTLHIGGARLDFDAGVPPEERQAALGGYPLLTLGGALQGAYYFPYFGALGGQFLTLGGGVDAVYDVNVWRGIQHARGDEWQDGGPLGVSSADGWRSSERLQAGSRDEWDAGLPRFQQVPDAWGDMPRLRDLTRDEWNAGHPLQTSARDTYIYMSALRRFLADDWQHGVPMATLAGDGYVDLPRYLRLSPFTWTAGQPLTRFYTDAWTEGLLIRALTPDEWHAGRYLLPGKTPWPASHPGLLEPVFRSGRLDFGRVLWTPVTRRLDFDAVPYFPVRLYYIIMTTASIVRLPDRKNLPISRIAISYDWDSWDCRIAATLLGKQAYTDAIAADTIEVSINGHKRQARIDKITGDRSFGSNSYSLTASTLAVELAPPIAQSQTWYNANARTMAQLADAVLTNTGWAVTWSAADWTVPAGLWSSQSAPINAIARLAEAAGAYVLPHPVNKTLQVLPRYAVLPWNWAQEHTDIIIPASVTRQISWEPVELAPYNAVYVAGENGGVIGHCVIQGTAGDIVAPMVTDALICAPDAARARGRAILAETGTWTHYRLQLPIGEPNSEIPLLEIGTLVQFQDVPINPWKGLITGTNVSADWQNGLRLTQELYIRRYHG